MRYEVAVAPATTPIGIEDAKKQMNIEHRDTDTYINSLVLSATALIEAWTNRKIMTQTIDYFIDGFPRADNIRLPFGEPTSITSLKYHGSDDSENTMSNTEYSLDKYEDKIILDYGESWPSDTLRTLHPVEIRFVCGWASRNVVPETLKQAICLTVAHYYESREPVVIGAGITVSELPLGIDALIAPYRIVHFEGM